MEQGYQLKGPHIRCEEDTPSIMQDVLVALTPSALWGIYAFGLRALVILCISILSCVLMEFAVRKLFRRPVTLFDLSAVVTGAILAMGMPVSVPLWLVPLGAVIAIGVAKQLFGGLGKNFFNPALTGLAFLHLFFSRYMNRFTQPFVRFSPFRVTLPEEEISSALVPSHPLQLLKEGLLPEDLTLSDMITGSMPGNVGEVASLLLLAGLLYLLVRRVVSWHIPVFFLGTLAVLTAAFPLTAPQGRWDFMAASLLSGSAILGAAFMATDPVTSPVTSGGKICYAILCGILTVWFRYRTGVFDGTVFAILLSQVTPRFWDFLFRPRVYGKKRDLVLSLQSLPDTLRELPDTVRSILDRFQRKE